MTDRQRLLIRLLAKADAIWSPLRAVDWNAWGMGSVVFEHRRDFVTAGFAFGSSIGKATERFSFGRLLDGLAGDGLLVRFGGERKVRCRLSEAGDDHARALAGLPGIGAAFATILELAKHRRVSELQLAGLEGYRNDDAMGPALVRAELAAMPGIWRGWIATESDVAGRVWYSVTDLGREVSHGPPVTLPDGLPKEVAGGFELYGAEFRHARHALRASSPVDRREVGLLPLSASMKPELAETA